MTTNGRTFYWYDYETFGAYPQWSRIAQIAGVRTDTELNEIDSPLNYYCRPQADILPDPASCLVHGISPIVAQEKGIAECELAHRVYAQLNRPDTCAVGYNSMRFDHEITRHLFYRNFYNPYRHEINPCSRWDVIDMFRMTYALRPDGLQWALNEEGQPSFRLLDLAHANGINYHAHDALADVRATIALVRLLKEKQLRLFDHALSLRNRQGVCKFISPAQPRVLHFDYYYPKEEACATMLLYLMQHPTIKNQYITYDLRQDPELLLTSSVEECRAILFSSPQSEISPRHLGLKVIKLNQSPMLAPEQYCQDEQILKRLNLSYDECCVKSDKLMSIKKLTEKVQAIYQHLYPEKNDPDLMLYSSLGWSYQDQRALKKIRAASADELRTAQWQFEDQRLPEMLFRYRARNFPQSLSDSEAQRWRQDCAQRITKPPYDKAVNLEQYLSQIETMQKTASVDEHNILNDLRSYAQQWLVDDDR